MQVINKSAELEELIFKVSFLFPFHKIEKIVLFLHLNVQKLESLSSVFASAAVRACLFKIFAKPLFVSQNERIRETIRPGTSSEG